MTVRRLFCEGKQDARLVRAILGGMKIAIAPSGGKYGLGQKIRDHRDILPAINIIAGIRDGDFDHSCRPEEQSPIGKSALWKVENNTIWLGWYWERVELENYLIDPIVVRQALGTTFPIEAYTTLLQNTAQSLATYTVARVALTRARERRLPMPNSWGRERRFDNHVLPDKFPDDTTCRQEIDRIVLGYQGSIQPHTVITTFNTLLPHYQPGGACFQHFLVCFSGKDLLVSMESGLQQGNIGYQSAKQFREHLLKRIEDHQESVWTWLPEWVLLRQQIEAVASHNGP